jgi:SAM (Sterile alpha motif) domain-containing protein
VDVTWWLSEIGLPQYAEAFRANNIDPEDLRDLLRAHHACCADVVRRFDGSVAQYLGDGVVVRFGQVQKQRTMEVLEEELVLRSRRGPVLAVFEDAHWIDATSLELMNRIIRRALDLPVMVIVVTKKYSLAAYLNAADLKDGWVRVARGEIDPPDLLAARALLDGLSR